MKGSKWIARNGSLDTAHDEARFIRMPDGRSEPFASPADGMLKKLDFFREWASSKHLRDIASMIAVQGEAGGLDHGHPRFYWEVAI